MVKGKKGFTLVELVMVVLFLGICAYVAVPRLSLAIIFKQKADSLAGKIVTDFRRTRRLAISDAANNTAGFALKMTGSSPYTGYKIENLNTAETVDSWTIDPSIACTGGDEFKFGTLGNLLTGSDTELSISADGRIFTINITAATGMVKCTEN
ncbi:MAG TPA: prepilin-type N-terminal cleavage/methylation domain-containing protein [Sedimentisphaerales bacterium]|nr:prepilin-type N-terminal cleavage/methylation domain-containing protein [Sedimentisphaerales bacterium]